MSDGSGEPLDFRLYFQVNELTGLAISERLSEWLSAIGISTELSAIESVALRAEVWERDFDMAVYVYGYDWDPEFQLMSFTCMSLDWDVNFPGYCSESFDEMYFAQTIEPNLDERQEYVFEAQRILHEDVPYIQLLYLYDYEVYRNDRFNVTITGSSNQFWGIRGMWGIETVD